MAPYIDDIVRDINSLVKRGGSGLGTPDHPDTSAGGDSNSSGKDGGDTSKKDDTTTSKDDDTSQSDDNSSGGKPSPVAVAPPPADTPTPPPAAPPSVDPNAFGKGATPASSFNNNAFLVLFALIGVGMTLSSLWFFFWARNGGFKWRKGDWDDYKSTVLRRKGPDGKTLSNATRSTKLGGGSVVHGQSKYTGDGMSSFSGSSYTDLPAAERGKAGGYRGGGGPTTQNNAAARGARAAALKTRAEQQRDRDRNRKSATQHNSTSPRKPRDRTHDHSRDPELSSYRHERPARVGGMNRTADGSHWDYSNSSRSELSSHQHHHNSHQARHPPPAAANAAAAPPQSKKAAKAERKEAKEDAKRQRRAAKDAAALEKRARKAEQAHNNAARSEASYTRANTDEYEDEDGDLSNSMPGGYASQYARVRQGGVDSVDGYTDDSYYSRYRPSANGGGGGRRGDRNSHYIPGLRDESEVKVEDSVSQVAGRTAAAQAQGQKSGVAGLKGFRRFGGK